MLFLLLCLFLFLTGAASMGKVEFEKTISVFGYLIGLELSEKRPFAFNIEKVVKE